MKRQRCQVRLLQSHTASSSRRDSLHLGYYTLLTICSKTSTNLCNGGRIFPGFRALAHFLHGKHFRQRLVGFCISEQHACMAKHFVEGTPNPAEWRWGIIASTLAKMLPLRKALQAVWNPVLYKKGPGGHA